MGFRSGGNGRREKRNKKLRIAVLLVIVALFAVLLRLSWLSSEHLDRAKLALTQGNSREAVNSYTWVIRNYYPGNPFATIAVEEIIKITETHHAENRPDEEKQALEDLRATLYSIRSFYQPYSESLQSIEVRLASIDYPHTED